MNSIISSGAIMRLRRFGQRTQINKTINTMTRTFTSFAALLLAVSFIVGCGGEPRPAGMPRLYSASIVVTQGGEPLEGASVTLTPEDPENARWGPMGTTDGSGVAVLRTDGKYAGAPLGAYKVVVSKLQIIDPPPGTPGESRGVNHVPSQYASIADTPLRVEITAKGRTYPVEVEEIPGR